MLWGCWVCRAHGLAYERAIATDTTPFPPQQPCREKRGVGKGDKPSPAAMGVTIVDLAFMHAIATEGEKDKAARQEIKAKRTQKRLLERLVRERRRQDKRIIHLLLIYRREWRLGGYSYIA